MLRFIKLSLIAGTVTLTALSGSLAAGTPGFDPHAPCGPTLREADDTKKLMIASWGLGVRAVTAKPVPKVALSTISPFLRQLIADCIKDETVPLTDLVGVSADAMPDAVPGSRQDAEQLLSRFFDKNEDLVALTASLMPDPGDVSAVYNEPLAGKLAESYKAAFKPGMKFGPKPHQDSLIIIHTTTEKLKNRDAVLREFPGGYAKVLPFLKDGHPIVRFKFVKGGEDLGLAFDGLVHVNGRWVLMPKPWRALE